MDVNFSKTYQVVIIGGGPIGMGLAIELGQRGISVAVVEKYPQVHNIPKGQNLTQRTMEHFQSWGAESALRAARVVPRDHAIGGMTSYGTLLSKHHYNWMQRDLVRPFYNTDNERLPQYETEKVLRARAEQLASVDILYGWSGDDVTQDEKHVSVTLKSRVDGSTKTLKGQYLVGADGSRSAIRQAAGISQTEGEHERRMVLLVFKSTGLHKHLERYPGKQFYCVLHPKFHGYWQFFGRVDLGTTWFFHAPVPSDTTADNFDFTAFVQQAAGAEFDIEFDHIGFWDLRVALADNYRKGRVFIAGDAAHSHPPYGGYGINTGFEDARNLGWKLAAELNGWGGANLLDSYSAERQPVFASTAKDFIEHFINEDDEFLKTYSPDKDQPAFEAAWNKRNEGNTEVMAFAPNYDGSSIVFGKPGAKPSAKASHVFRARAGHHLAPAEMSDGQNSFDLLADGFTLFAFGAARSETAAFARAAIDLGMPLAIVESEDSEARVKYQASLILVRPDQFVAWSGDGATLSAMQILSRAIGSVSK